MVPKNLKRSLLYTSKRYHALVNPDGVAGHIGTEYRCLGIWFEMRFKRPWLNDADMETARVTLKASGWQIIPVRMALFTQDVTVTDVEKIAPRASDAVLSRPD